MLWFLMRVGWANTAVIFALALAPAVALTKAPLGSATSRVSAQTSAQAEMKAKLAAAFDASAETLRTGSNGHPAAP